MHIEVKQLKEYNEALIKELFTLGGDTDVIPQSRFFDDEKNILLVAYFDDKPAGFLYAYVLEGVKRKQPKMFLYSIDVFDEYQRKGAGRALMESLKQITKDFSCHEIFVLTNESNDKAMKFYEATGGVREGDDVVMFVYV